MRNQDVSLAAADREPVTAKADGLALVAAVVDDVQQGHRLPDDGPEGFRLRWSGNRRLLAGCRGLGLGLTEQLGPAVERFEERGRRTLGLGLGMIGLPGVHPHGP